MTPQPYVTDPHFNVQKALAEARRQGATTARIHFSSKTRHAVMEDNWNGEGTVHHQTFNTNVHPSTGHQWDTNRYMRAHLSPPGLLTTIDTEYYDGSRAEHTLANLDDEYIATKTTPDGRYTVHLTRENRPFPITLVNSDGTSDPVNPDHYQPTYHETPDRNPDTQVNTVSLSAVAVAASQEGISGRQHSRDLLDIQDTVFALAGDHIAQLAASSPGYVWPHKHTRRDIDQDLPLGPSTSEYMVDNPDGSRMISTRLTPANAVLCDYDTVQSDMLNYAITNHAPRDLKPVRTDDPSVPTLRLLSTEVENLDGSTFEYPVNVWDMESQSGRYDNRPQPYYEHRLPHSRIGTVRDIRLTMEVSKPGTEPDVFTFSTDVYVDQDRNHHLLLITQDSKATRTQIDHMAYLYTHWRRDLDDETKEALSSEPEDLKREYMVHNLLEGPYVAAKKALRAIAAIAEAMDMSGENVEALSPQGTVRITLNPTPPESTTTEGPAFVPFVTADLNMLDRSKAINVPTAEYPGAIRPSLALIYSPSDGKLETFQPRTTHFTYRVHPLTVRMANSQAAETVASTPNTAWVVVGAGHTHLTVVPVPINQLDPTSADSLKNST